MHPHTPCVSSLLSSSFSPLIASEPEGPLAVTQAALVRLGPEPTELGSPCEQVNTMHCPTKSISLRDLQGRRWKHCFTTKTDTDLLWNRI